MACLDIGHLNITAADTGDTVDGAIRKLGKYLEILHVHDTDAYEDLHTAPFMGGNIHWVKVMQALKDIQYDKTFNFEVGGRYFKPYGTENLQTSANFLYQIGKFLTEYNEM